MMLTTNSKGLCKAAVAFTLLLIFAVDGSAQTKRVDERFKNAVDKAERGRGDPPAACRDTTPHKTRFVRVERGVELEVVDWGGENKPQTMVLLTGLGDNAHVFDGFAQQFTDYFHVIGITRRGFAPSSQPKNGYDVETRARDDIAVLDALRIGRATFVGHSLAGSELTKLGELYGNRVDKLVFLDATDLADRFSPSRAEPPGTGDLFSGDALKSLWAFQAASARYSALRKPDAAVCNDAVFGPKGELLASRTPDWVFDKLQQGVTGAENPRVDWARIVAPRLGIFAQYTAEERQTWYWYLSAAEQAEFDRAWPSILAWHKDTIDKFANGNPTPTVRLYGVPHYVYINNEAEVVREMRRFLGLPVGGN
jgi:pimeloyl-ACP methyl ester carboxylesterase